MSVEGLTHHEAISDERAAHVAALREEAARIQGEAQRILDEADRVEAGDDLGAPGQADRFEASRDADTDAITAEQAKTGQDIRLNPDGSISYRPLDPAVFKANALADPALIAQLRQELRQPAETPTGRHGAQNGEAAVSVDALLAQRSREALARDFAAADLDGMTDEQIAEQFAGPADYYGRQDQRPAERETKRETLILNKEEADKIAAQWEEEDKPAPAETADPAKYNVENGYSDADLVTRKNKLLGNLAGAMDDSSPENDGELSRILGDLLNITKQQEYRQAVAEKERQAAAAGETFDKSTVPLEPEGKMAVLSDENVADVTELLAGPLQNPGDDNADQATKTAARFVEMAQLESQANPDSRAEQYAREKARILHDVALGLQHGETAAAESAIEQVADPAKYENRSDEELANLKEGFLKELSLGIKQLDTTYEDAIDGPDTDQLDRLTGEIVNITKQQETRRAARGEAPATPENPMGYTYAQVSDVEELADLLMQGTPEETWKGYVQSATAYYRLSRRATEVGGSARNITDFAQEKARVLHDLSTMLYHDKRARVTPNQIGNKATEFVKTRVQEAQTKALQQGR